MRPWAWAFALLPCAAGGCGVQRATAVELAPEVAFDASSSADGASDGPGETGAHTGEDASPMTDAPDGTPATVTPSCDSPRFTSSSPEGIWTEAGAGYYVFNDVWDTEAGPGPQTIFACSYQSFYVESDQPNDGGAVESYPNVQMNFPHVPIGSMKGIASTFVEQGPRDGSYEFAYDVWLDGVGVPNAVQVLVWVDPYDRVPDGTQVMANMPLGGRTYDVWVTVDDLHIVLVATAAFSSGTVDLLGILRWTIGQGWLLPSSTLEQIDFGVEIVSTGGVIATYAVNDFSLTVN